MMLIIIICALVRWADARNDSHLLDDDDDDEQERKIDGQVNYLIAMFVVYALIVVILLVLRIKPYARYQKERIDCEKAEHLLRDMEEQTVTRNILEQLKNSEFRDKAWKIYRANSPQDLAESSRELKHAMLERITLETITKKIETINKAKQGLEDYDKSLMTTPRLQTQVSLNMFRGESRIDKLNKKYRSGQLHSQPGASSKRQREQAINSLREWANSFQMRHMRSSSADDSPSQSAKTRSHTIHPKLKLNMKKNKRSVLFEEDIKKEEKITTESLDPETPILFTTCVFDFDAPENTDPSLVSIKSNNEEEKSDVKCDQQEEDEVEQERENLLGDFFSPNEFATSSHIFKSSQSVVSLKSFSSLR